MKIKLSSGDHHTEIIITEDENNLLISPKIEISEHILNEMFSRHLEYIFQYKKEIRKLLEINRSLRQSPIYCLNCGFTREEYLPKMEKKI